MLVEAMLLFNKSKTLLSGMDISVVLNFGLHFIHSSVSCIF